jgi:hypothetical protein
VIAVLLMVLSWLWSPRSGFIGLGHMLSRYLMTLGLPFERWVERLAELAGQETQPQRFLGLALQHMQDLPWVSAVEWTSRQGEGEIGKRSQFLGEMSFQDLRLNIYTRWSLSPAMLLHLKLLTQMVGHFYDAKRREEAQRQRAYTQAIYETGARLTHDVKNLLQSLRSLCAAVETSSEGEAPALQALMQRQLPQITQRLNATLDKLHAPQQADTSLVDAGIWWDALRQRYSHRDVRFEASGAEQDVKLPSELFDSVADNLIENALNKASDTEVFQVRVTFAASGRRHAHRVRQRRGRAQGDRIGALRGTRELAHRARRGALPCRQAGGGSGLPARARRQRAGHRMFRAHAHGGRAERLKMADAPLLTYVENLGHRRTVSVERITESPLNVLASG